MRDCELPVEKLIEEMRMLCEETELLLAELVELVELAECVDCADCEAGLLEENQDELAELLPFEELLDCQR